MADTIVSEADMADFQIHDAPSIDTNFGMLTGGWVRVAIPALGFDEEILAYASDNVAAMTRKCHRTLEGLAGLPLLRMFEYGGDPDWFWLRRNA